MKNGYTLIVITMVLLAASGSAWPDKTPYQGNGSLILEPSELQWGKVGSMAPGARIAVIEGSLGEPEPFTIRLKLPPDYRIDAHHHPEYERVTVLSGTLYFAEGGGFDRSKAKALRPGAVAIMPPGTPMFGFTGDEETIIQLHGTGPWGIEYENPEDDPRG